MSDTQDNLDQLLDAWQVPPLGGDLTSAILARAKAEDRALDDLLAFSVRQITSAGPRLSRDLSPAILAKAQAEDQALDRLLLSADAVPELAADFTQPVMRTIRRRRLTKRILTLGGSLAAAAAVLVVTLILHPGKSPSPSADNQVGINQPGQVGQAGLKSQTLPTSPAVADDGGVAKLFNASELAMLKEVTPDELAKDLPVLIHLDTIREMERLEKDPPKTDDVVKPDSVG